MAVVTVSGQSGSGAREIGRLAAQRLSIDYVDQEVLVGAARELGVPMESVVPLDERAATLGERLAAVIRRFLERSAAAGAGDPMLGGAGLDIVLGRTYAEAAATEEISPERYLATLAGVIRDLAAHDNVLIIGRGSQMILKEWPGALHVLLVAPLAWRIDNIARAEDRTREEAAKRVHDGDKGRQAFHRKFFKVDVDDPSHYHLTLNVARLTPAEATALIAEAAQQVGQRPPT